MAMKDEAPVPDEQPQAADFDKWAEAVRGREEAAGPPPLPPRPHSPLTRWAVSAALLLAVGAAATVALTQMMPGPPVPVTGTVRGVVVNAQGRPLADAWIFLASAPQLECRTQTDGSFELAEVPQGRQYVIVAVNKRGQEHRIWMSPAGDTVDLGTVKFEAVRVKK